MDYIKEKDRINQMRHIFKWIRELNLKAVKLEIFDAREMRYGDIVIDQGYAIRIKASDGRFFYVRSYLTEHEANELFVHIVPEFKKLKGEKK